MQSVMAQNELILLPTLFFNPGLVSKQEKINSMKKILKIFQVLIAIISISIGLYYADTLIHNLKYVTGIYHTFTLINDSTHAVFTLRTLETVKRDYFHRTFIYGTLRIENYSSKNITTNLKNYSLLLSDSLKGEIYYDSYASYIYQDEIQSAKSFKNYEVYWAFDRIIFPSDIKNVKLYTRED